MKQCPSWNSKTTVTKNTRSRQFAAVLFMQKSQRVATYQAYTTWCHGRATQKRRIPGSQHQPSNISGDYSALFTKSTQRSQQQPHPPLIWLHQRLGLQLSQGPGTISESAADQLRPAALANAPKRIEPRSLLIPGPSSVFSSLKLGGFFTNAFSFSLTEPPGLAG